MFWNCLYWKQAQYVSNVPFAIEQCVEALFYSFLLVGIAVPAAALLTLLQICAVPIFWYAFIFVWGMWGQNLDDKYWLSTYC